jgi:hypothetical protein
MMRLFFGVEDEQQPAFFWGRVVLYVFLVGWGVRFLLGGPYHDVVLLSFMHNINLPIHEAGHVVFGPLGWFIGVLGGSLMQLLVPLVFMAAFLFQYKNPFAASVSLWWFAQNFMDLAPYIGDAKDQAMMLLGGVTGRDAPGYHDWNNILGELGLLDRADALGQLSYDIGRFLMVLMFAWGGYLLVQQFQRMHAGKQEPWWERQGRKRE